MFSNKTQIQNQILDRYAQHGRKFPWRETQDPYLIHISEVMSQQTQIDRVLKYRENWIQILPDYQSLAEVSKLELLALRSGLGFNARALRLQAAAQEVMEKYQGKLPQSKSLLLELPGIGPYTASAICAFTRNQAEAVVDTNIRRVLIFLLKLDPSISLKELTEIAQDLIPEGRSRDWHNALMDYGALYLTAKKTKIRSLNTQSKFEGSDRQVRGWVIRALIKGNGKFSYSKLQEAFPHKNLKKILQEMSQEGQIIWNSTEISLLE